VDEEHVSHVSHKRIFVRRIVLGQGKWYISTVVLSTQAGLMRCNMRIPRFPGLAERSTSHPITQKIRGRKELVTGAVDIGNKRLEAR
jgi:hypothetical protein